MPADGPSRGVAVGQEPLSELRPRPKMFRPTRQSAEQHDFVVALELRTGGFLELFPRDQKLTAAYGLRSNLVSGPARLADYTTLGGALLDDGL